MALSIRQQAKEAFDFLWNTPGEALAVLLVDGLGNPLHFMLTAGQRHDI